MDREMESKISKISEDHRKSLESDLVSEIKSAVSQPAMDSIDIANQFAPQDHTIQNEVDKNRESRKERILNKLSKLMTKTDIIEYDLPCGLIYFGDVYRKIRLRRLRGEDKRRSETFLAKGDLAGFQNNIILSTLVSIGDKFFNFDWVRSNGKSYGIKIDKSSIDIDMDIINKLSIPDRTFIFWRSYMITGMDEDGKSIMSFTIKCPKCGEETVFEYDVSKAKFDTREDRGLVLDPNSDEWTKTYIYEYGDDRYEITLRLGNGNLQSEVSPFLVEKDFGKVNQIMTEYSIFKIDGMDRDDLLEYGIDVSQFLKSAKTHFLDWLDSKLKDMSPTPVDEVIFKCPKCKFSLKQEVSIDSFLLENSI